MNDPNQPNQPNKSKAEGERWSSEPGAVERQDRQSAVDTGEVGGITNRPRPRPEGVRNVEEKEAVPRRPDGRTRTPRRYDEENPDPTLPSDDSALRTEM